MKNEMTGIRRTDEYYMKKALQQARKAADIGEVPIGCVIVYTGPLDKDGKPKRKANYSKGDRALTARAEEQGICPGDIIGRGYNKRNKDHSTLSHAELTAIRKACKKLGDWRLEGCTMYVTLEPCMMCSGACVQCRIDRVVIGAANPKAGCAGSLLNLLNEPKFNHQVAITENVEQEACSKILQQFFAGEIRCQKTGGML